MAELDLVRPMREQLAICLIACLAPSCAADRAESPLATAQVRARPPLAESELHQIVRAIRRATPDPITSIDRTQLEHGPDVLDVVTTSSVVSTGFRLEKRRDLWRIVERGKILP